MTITEALRSKEALLPETLRMLFPNIREEDFEKLEAINTLLHSSQPYENCFIFENIVLALNGERPDFSTMQGCTPEQIFFAFYVIDKLDPKFYFDWEVKQWVRVLLNIAGIFFYPPALGLQDSESIPYEIVAKKAAEGPFPLQDDTILDIQASKCAAIDLYIDKMIAKEVWKELS
jgi:hypothetical protein